MHTCECIRIEALYEHIRRRKPFTVVCEQLTDEESTPEPTLEALHEDHLERVIF